MYQVNKHNINKGYLAGLQFKMLKYRRWLQWGPVFTVVDFLL